MKAHLLAFSLGNLSKNNLNAANVSGTDLRLIFLELNIKTKSYSLPWKKFFLTSVNLESLYSIG